MSTPARATRRSTRAAATAEAASSPSKSSGKDSVASPVASHPIHGEPAPPSSAGRGKNGSKVAPAAKSGGGPPAYLLLAVLAVSGGVLYTQYMRPRDGGSSLVPGPADERQARVAQPPLPHVAFTREEEQVFEKVGSGFGGWGLPGAGHILGEAVGVRFGLHAFGRKRGQAPGRT